MASALPILRARDGTPPGVYEYPSRAVGLSVCAVITLVSGTWHQADPIVTEAIVNFIAFCLASTCNMVKKDIDETVQVAFNALRNAKVTQVLLAEKVWIVFPLVLFEAQHWTRKAAYTFFKNGTKVPKLTKLLGGCINDGNDDIANLVMEAIFAARQLYSNCLEACYAKQRANRIADDSVTLEIAREKNKTYNLKGIGTRLGTSNSTIAPSSVVHMVVVAAFAEPLWCPCSNQWISYTFTGDKYTSIQRVDHGRDYPSQHQSATQRQPCCQSEQLQKILAFIQYCGPVLAMLDSDDVQGLQSMYADFLQLMDKRKDDVPDDVVLLTESGPGHCALDYVHEGEDMELDLDPPMDAILLTEADVDQEGPANEAFQLP
eukprot:TRINITY_DN3984_c0_g1_i1.p1 TRINITY_DN3984_c0_g1~~TRINITY_DN3984_c0_g1_i1.p1  ORF type:complete len:397 (+),score=36.80 TRINITY_DN3984_c0_g1_i1:67-1191(+)